MNSTPDENLDQTLQVKRKPVENPPAVPDQNTLAVVQAYLADIRRNEWMEFKISNDADVKRTSNAICWYTCKGKKIYCSAIGAGAVNQAVKSIIIASSKLRAEGFSLSIIPGFHRDDEGELTGAMEAIVLEENKTVIRFFLKVEYGI